MVLKGKVLNAKTEERELVGKDGVKKNAKITHVLLQSADTSSGIEILNVKAYDVSWPLPDVGKDWTTPRVRRYENYDGQIADVTVES